MLAALLLAAAPAAAQGPQPSGEDLALVDALVQVEAHGGLERAAQALGLQARWLGDVPSPVFHVRAPAFLLRELERAPGLRVEPDLAVEALLEGSVPASGVTQARADFGVDGDLDGDPARASTGDVGVAVLDTGIDASHPDLQGRVVGWKDLVDGRSQPYDDHGHGTHVAGIVAATGGSDGRHRGVAPGASLVGVKVLDGEGRGSSSAIIEGIRWAVEQRHALGIRVISMSLGSSGCSSGTDALSRTVDWAVQQGVLVVVAAGNSGPGTCTIGSPAAASLALTVGSARDPTEGGVIVSQFSSRGPTADGRVKPDLVAPGDRITAPRAGGGHVAFRGTSMATPFVSGAAALLLDASPGLGPREVKDLLVTTAMDLGAPGPDAESGAGFLDTHAALRAALGRDGPGFRLPAHRAWAGELGSEPLELRVDAGRGVVGASVLAPSWSRGQPELRITLLGPEGTALASADTRAARQGALAASAGPGTLALRVEGPAGAKAVVDLSYAAGAAPPPPDPQPTPPPPPPQEPPKEPPPQEPPKEPPPQEPPKDPPRGGRTALGLAGTVEGGQVKAVAQARDEAGQPIQGRTVWFLWGRSVQRALTDAAGEARFEGSYAGGFRVLAAYAPAEHGWSRASAVALVSPAGFTPLGPEHAAEAEDVVRGLAARLARAAG